MTLRRCTKAERLLEESVAAYYWAGLLAADGTIGRQGKHLKLALGDREHVRLFADFIGWEGKIGLSKDGRSHSVSFAYASVIPVWRAKFGLHARKTYAPPEVLVGDTDLRFAFAVGFVDGDGCVKLQSGGRRGAVIAVKCHASWLVYLDALRATLAPGSPPARVNARGYAFFAVSDHTSVKAIHARAKELELPLLTRKWDKIDHTFISGTELSDLRINEVKRLLAEGKQKQIVADQLGICGSAVSRIIKTTAITTYRRRGPDLVPRKRANR